MRTSNEKSRFTKSRLSDILKQQKVANLAREHRVSEEEQVWRLEDKNRWLKKLVADLSLNN